MGRPDASVSKVTGSGILLGEKAGVLVAVVVAMAVALGITLVDGQNQSVEVKSLTRQLLSIMGAVLARGLGTSVLL